MYLDQVKKFKASPILYFIIPLAFIALMVFNYFISQGMDTNDAIKDSIKMFGVNGTFIMIVAPLSFGLLLVFFWVKIVQQQTITSLTTARKKIDWKRILMSFSIWSLFIASMTLISYFSNPESFVWNFKPVKFLVFLAFAVILIPMQTSFEEYLFRGNLMQGLALVTKNKWFPLLLTSFLFGIMHIANPEVAEMGPIIMVYYIGTGLFLGILTLMDDGLELALGFHAANNLIGALLVTSDWTVFQTHSILKDVSENTSTVYEILVPVFILFPLLLVLFSKIYKWENWKERLTGKISESAKINDINA